MFRRLSLVVLAVVAVGMISGCATAPKGPSDEELIKQTIADWTAAAVAKDVDKVMAFVSPNFQSDTWADKEAYKEFVVESIDMGYLDDLTVSTEKAVIKIEGDKATVSPVDLEAAFGMAALDVELTKEGGKWLVTNVTMDQY